LPLLKTLNFVVYKVFQPGKLV